MIDGSGRGSEALSVRDVNRVLDGLGIAGCDRLPRDLGSPRTHVYRLDDVVVKFARERGDVRARRERDALALLVRSSLPVPGLLGWGDLPDGRPWVVMTRLGGSAPEDARRPAHEVSEPLAGAMGRTAAALHAHPAPGFGTWSRDPGFSLLDEQRQRRGAVLAMARAARLVRAAEVDVVDALLERTEDALTSAPREPVLTHRDLHPGNVLVDDAGALCGLVDFEAAGGGDPVEDFTRVAFDWSTRAFAAFCRGYRVRGGVLHGDAADRLAYYVVYSAALIFGRVGADDPRYLGPARVAVERVASGERPDLGPAVPHRCPRG